MPPAIFPPRDVWQAIFLFAAADSSIGPPSHIIPIISTCRQMHDMLCACRVENAHLYASIFRGYFDTAAPSRRLGNIFTTSSAYSLELRDRFACIQRIRRRTHACFHPMVLTDDLCRSMFMLLESDSKNNILLFQYADIAGFVLDSARTYLFQNASNISYPTPHLSFLLWLLWLVSSYDGLLAEDKSIAEELQSRLLPFAVAAWIYKDYPPLISSSLDNSSGPSPNYETLSSYTTTVFSHSISFKIPPLSSPAILSFCSRADGFYIRRAQAFHDLNTTVNQPPATESLARAKRLLASTVAGLDEGLGDDRLVKNTSTDHLFPTPSERFDDDWARLRVFPREAKIFGAGTLGSVSIDFRRLLAIISGTWEGRMEYPAYDQYMLLRDAGITNAESYDELFISSIPLSCHFDVFYCLDASNILRTPQDKDGILNAYFPPDTEIDITQTDDNGELRIWDRITKTISTYQLYHPTEGTEQFLSSTEIQDIIIVGNSISDNPGLFAQYKGRVRRDGLIIMARNGPQLGKELIRGYVHQGRSLVGRWRTTAPPAQTSSWEGPVFLVRREDVST